MINQRMLALGNEPSAIRELFAYGLARKAEIGDDKVFYLMSRGISEEEARTMIVNGFANPVSKELPLEYAVEMNNLIKLEMEGAIG